MKFWLYWGSAIAVGALLFVWLETTNPLNAQGKPFNVYETPGACVYVTGYAYPAIYVIPKTLMSGGC